MAGEHNITDGELRTFAACIHHLDPEDIRQVVVLTVAPCDKLSKPHLHISTSEMQDMELIALLAAGLRMAGRL